MQKILIEQRASQDEPQRTAVDQYMAFNLCLFQVVELNQFQLVFGRFSEMMAFSPGQFWRSTVVKLLREFKGSFITVRVRFQGRGPWLLARPSPALSVDQILDLRPRYLLCHLFVTLPPHKDATDREQSCVNSTPCK